jgi:hypothetical protein
VRARPRRQSLEWLRAELATWTPWLRGWIYTHELAGVREPALISLPEDEQRAWRAFWREVDGWLPVDPG